MKCEEQIVLILETTYFLNFFLFYYNVSFIFHGAVALKLKLTAKEKAQKVKALTAIT